MVVRRSAEADHFHGPAAWSTPPVSHALILAQVTVVSYANGSPVTDASIYGSASRGRFCPSCGKTAVRPPQQDCLMPNLNTAVVDTERAEQGGRLQRSCRLPQVLAPSAPSQVRAVCGDDRAGLRPVQPGNPGPSGRGWHRRTGMRLRRGPAWGAGPIRGTTGRSRRCRLGQRPSPRTAGLRPPQRRYASAGAGPFWPGRRVRHRPRRRRR